MKELQEVLNTINRFQKTLELQIEELGLKNNPFYSRVSPIVDNIQDSITALSAMTEHEIKSSKELEHIDTKTYNPIPKNISAYKSES